MIIGIGVLIAVIGLLGLLGLIPLGLIISLLLLIGGLAMMAYGWGAFGPHPYTRRAP